MTRNIVRVVMTYEVPSVANANGHRFVPPKRETTAPIAQNALSAEQMNACKFFLV